MKITLEGCRHGKYATLDTADDVVRATCLICYQRIVGTFDRATYQPVWSAAPAPTFICAHRSKDPIQKSPKFANKNFTDALCNDCGVVLRHPDGKGEWTEVLFNGYLIREEP